MAKTRFLGTVEVSQALTDKEAVNLGQVKDLVNRYNKEPVKAATTGELNGTYATNVLTVTGALSPIDGITLGVDDEVLVKDQLDKTQNGIYVVTSVTPSTPSSATASIGASTGITDATVDADTFETKISTTGNYTFTYDGVTDNAWKYSGSTVTLADYGITPTGAPNDADTIEVSYTEATTGSGELTRRADFEEGKVILNNTFVNVMQGVANGDTRWTIVSDGVLTVGTASFTFVKDIDTQSSSINVVKGSITGDGATTSFNVAHNLNLADTEAYLIHVKDNTGNDVIVDHAPTTANEANSITVTFATAPLATETFKIYIIGLE